MGALLEVYSCHPFGVTALHLSTRFGHFEVLRLLLDHGVNVNARTDNHWTSMHISAAQGYTEIVNLLLERGADIHAMNATGETLYLLSLRTGNREIADLISKNGGRRVEERFERTLL